MQMIVAMDGLRDERAGLVEVAFHRGQRQIKAGSDFAQFHSFQPAKHEHSAVSRVHAIHDRLDASEQLT